jgi:hypothetical protein
LEDLDVERSTLKWLLNKQCRKIWTGIFYLREGTLVRTALKLDFLKERDFLD